MQREDGRWVCGTCLFDTVVGPQTLWRPVAIIRDPDGRARFIRNTTHSPRALIEAQADFRGVPLVCAWSTK